MAAGAMQFVLLSAGLDSFAARRPDLMARLQVFEVDHPDTQRFKRARLEDLGTALPENLHFASVDFEHEGIAEGLRREASWSSTSAVPSPGSSLAIAA
jgi:O-methyltransferase involved in polyketide biosynthesis